MRVLDPVEILLGDLWSASEMANKKKKEASNSSSRKTSAASPPQSAAVSGEFSNEGTPNSPSIKCRHLKSLNLNQLRKKVKNHQSFSCEDCRKEHKSDGTVEDSDEGESDDVFCCLACGHLGCGRYSKNQHAVKHHQKTRSTPHPLVVNLRTFVIWCYECDDEVPSATSQTLKEMVEMIGQHMKSASSNSKANGKAIEEIVKKSIEVSRSTPPAKTTRSTKTGNATPAEIKGLSNLGNTCFFNAVMQNMAQTHPLQFLLNDTKNILKGGEFKIQPVNCDNGVASAFPPLQFTLGEDPGALTIALRSFLADFRHDKSNILNPSSLFNQICKKAPRFRGFQQQDSHELLHYMMDSLRTEETRRLRACVLRHFGLDPENAKPDMLDSKMKNKVKAYGNVQSFVEQIFGGQLLQVIRCLQCQHVSRRHEQFLDLSLSIPDFTALKRNATVANLKDDDGDLKALERNEKNWNVSKHQQKKANKKGKKMAKNTNAKWRNSKTMAADQKDEKPEQNEDSTTVPNGVDIDAQLATEVSEKLDIADDVLRTASEASSNGTTVAPSELQPESEVLRDGVEKASESEESGDDDDHGQKKIENDEHSANGPTNDASMSAIEPLNTEDEAASRSGCTLEACLRQFTAVELLSGKNKFGCVNCAKPSPTGKTLQNGNTGSSNSEEQVKRNRKDSNPVVYTDAEKRYLIHSPPAVLTLHLKRFHQVGASMRKINKHVDFPLLLDIAPYCCKDGQRFTSTQDRIIYSLYGIVSHSGGLSGGHYVAYVKVRPKNEKSTSFLSTSIVAGSTDNKDCHISNGIAAHAEEAQSNPKLRGLDNGQADVQTTAPSSEQGKWYYVSDTHVSEVPESTVLAKEAYLLFYERIF